MNIKEQIKVHNNFTIEVRDATTGALKQVGKAENIVLDNWDFYKKPSYIFFGEGTDQSLENPTMKNLIKHLGSRNIHEQSRTIQNGYLVINYKSQTVNAGEFIGKQISEIGLSHSEYRDYLMTHAFIRDSEGNPLVITKTATDVIVFYATVYINVASEKYKTLRMAFDWFFYEHRMITNTPSRSSTEKKNTIKEPRREKGYFRINHNHLNGAAIRVIAHGNIDHLASAKKIIVFPEEGLFDGTYIKKEKLTGEKNGTNKNFNLKWDSFEQLKLYKNGQLLQENVDYTINCRVRKGKNLLSRMSTVELNDGVVFDEDFFYHIENEVYKVNMPYRRIFEAIMKSEKQNTLGSSYYYLKNFSSYVVSFKDPQTIDSYETEYSTRGSENNKGKYGHVVVDLYSDGQWKEMINGSFNSSLGYYKTNLKTPISNVTKARVKLTNPTTDNEWKKIFWLYLYQDTLDMITFTNPPTAEDVLEADYFVEYLAKDENHVVDIHLDATLSAGAGE